jgi:tellurite resistance protein TehA-like permease
MIWQDAVISVGSVVFTIALIPQLKDCIYNKAIVNVWSASMTSIILFIYCITYYTLSMYIAAIPLTATVWGMIAMYSFKNQRLTSVCQIESDTLRKY